jgi:hypothetical protein
MAADCSLGNAFSVQRADPLVWADERDRTDAAEVRLRQLYAEPGGMIGGSHNAERYTLSTRSAGTVGATRTVDMLELR